MNLETIKSREDNEKNAIVRRLHSVLDHGIPFRNITIPKLMDDLPYSETTFHRYFNSTNDVLIPLLLEIEKNAKVVSRAWYSGDNPDVIERLKESIKSRVDFIQPYGRVLGAVIDASGQDGTMHELWNKLMAYYISNARKNIEAQQAAGLIRYFDEESEDTREWTEGRDDGVHGQIVLDGFGFDKLDRNQVQFLLDKGMSIEELRDEYGEDEA